MKTIVFIALILGVLIAVAVAVRFDGRVSIGNYSPAEKAEAERLILLSKVEAERQKGMNAVELQEAIKISEMKVRNREILYSIAMVAFGAFTAVLIGGLCGALVFGMVTVVQKSKLPASGKVSPGWVVLKAPDGLKLLDVDTGAMFSLAGHRSPDQVRAGVEIARIQARIPEAIYIGDKEKADTRMEIVSK